MDCGRDRGRQRNRGQLRPPDAELQQGVESCDSGSVRSSHVANGLNDDASDALHVAAQRGEVDSVAALIASGADVNGFDDLGHTPLHYAAAHERLDVARLLLASGANVNARQLETAGN